MLFRGACRHLGAMRVEEVAVLGHAIPWDSQKRALQRNPTDASGIIKNPPRGVREWAPPNFDKEGEFDHVWAFARAVVLQTHGLGRCVAELRERAIRCNSNFLIQGEDQ